MTENIGLMSGIFSGIKMNREEALKFAREIKEIFYSENKKRYNEILSDPQLKKDYYDKLKAFKMFKEMNTSDLDWINANL